jgi:hypothetical protein
MNEKQLRGQLNGRDGRPIQLAPQLRDEIVGTDDGALLLTLVDPDDDGVVGVADVLGVGMPRPAGPGGALVGAVM